MLAVPLNTTEIIITGGFANGNRKGDVYKFNVESKEMSKILENDFQFYSELNQGILTRPGQVVGLVVDE